MKAQGDSPSSTDGAGRVTDAQIEAALLRLDADVRQRLCIFDGGPEVLSWENAHRLHRDEPYIGCPFCQDQFVLQIEAEQQREFKHRANQALEALRERTRVLEEALSGLLECFDGMDDSAPDRVMNEAMPWEDVVPRLKRARSSLAAVAVEDGGNGEGYETRSARPVPAGEGASLRWHLIDAGEHGVKASRLPTTVHFHVPLAAVEFNGTVAADPTHPSWQSPLVTEGES